MMTATNACLATDLQNDATPESSLKLSFIPRTPRSRIVMCGTDGAKQTCRRGGTLATAWTLRHKALAVSFDSEATQMNG
jgi:hypothetical protein